MSKQYLLMHTVPSDPPDSDSSPLQPKPTTFALATTPTSLFTAGSSSTITHLSTASSSFDPQPPLPAHPTGSHHIAASPTRLAAVSFAGTVTIYTASAPDDTPPSWTHEGSLPATTQAFCVAISPDGALLAIGTPTGGVETYTLPLGEHPTPRAAFHTTPSPALAVALSPDAAELASAHASGAVYTFSLAESRLVHALPGLVRPVRSVAYSPGGTLLAAAGDARIIALYDAKTGEQVAALKGHQSWVFGVAFSPRTGEWIASGGWDGRVKVWSVESRECVATLQEDGQPVWGVEWLKDSGKRGVGASVEGFAVGGKGGVRVYREAAGS